jgi:uncharacterized protein involved in exopolysaccharide biosynthesis
MNSPRPRTLAKYARAFKRRKLAILLSAVTFAVAAGICINRLPDIYESQSVVAAESIADAARRTTADLTDRLNWLKQRVSDREQLEALISSRGLYKDSSENGGRIEDRVSRMRSDIGVSPASDAEGGAGAFVISYRSSDPQTARQVATDIAERLIAESASISPQAADEAESLKRRAAELSSQMRDLEAKAPWLATGERGALAQTAPAARSPQYSAEILRAQQMTIEGLRDQQYKIQQQLADVDRRLTAQRQIVEQQKKSTGLRSDPTYAALIAKRAELQGQRDTLVNRQELTDKHPRVVAVNDQINAINRQIDELRQQDANTVAQSPEARELASLESDRNRLQLEFEITGREISRRLASASAPAPVAPAQNPARRDAASARLAGEYLDLKRDYEEVTAKLGDSEQTQAAGSVASRLRLVKEADLPARPLSPNRLLLALIAAAAGLALGAVFALAADARRARSIEDARDVEYYARVPLLAAIPKTTTAEERRRADLRAGLRFALGLVIAAGAAAALALVFTATELFEIIAKI